MRGLRDSFAKEFGASPDLKRKIGLRYREEKLDLEALLAGEGPTNVEPAMHLFRERSVSIRRSASRLRKLSGEGALLRSLEEIVASLAHMHANRLLRSSARAQEMVIYDLLSRLYLAREKRAV